MPMLNKNESRRGCTNEGISPFYESNAVMSANKLEICLE
jgi:hypothetical protein